MDCRRNGKLVINQWEAVCISLTTWAVGRMEGGGKKRISTKRTRIHSNLVSNHDHLSCEKRSSQSYSISAFALALKPLTLKS